MNKCEECKHVLIRTFVENLSPGCQKNKTKTFCNALKSPIEIKRVTLKIVVGSLHENPSKK